MQMKLYHVVVEGREPIYLMARTSHRASFAFICFELDAGRPSPDCTVKRIDDQLTAEQRVGLDEILAAGIPAFAAWDPLFGWCTIPPAAANIIFGERGR